MMTRFRRQYVRLVAGENLHKVELDLSRRPLSTQLVRRVRERTIEETVSSNLMNQWIVFDSHV